MFSELFSDLKLFLTLVFFSILLIFLDNLKILDFPKQELEIITIPIQYGLYKTSLKVEKQFEFIVLARRAAQENKALQDQLAQVLSENANLRRKLAETQGFLDQQQSLDPKTYNLLAARPVSLSGYLKIDKGDLDKVVLNQPVVYKDTLIGTIKEVSPKASMVMLPTDPDSKIAAFAQDMNGKAKGILIGQFGSEMLMDKILHQEPVKKGDLVYSEGTEGTLPRGLVLGQIFEVMERPNEIFKQAKVKSVFDVGNLDIVFIITNQ